MLIFEIGEPTRFNDNGIDAGDTTSSEDAIDDSYDGQVMMRMMEVKVGFKCFLSLMAHRGVIIGVIF